MEQQVTGQVHLFHWQIKATVNFTSLDLIMSFAPLIRIRFSLNPANMEPCLPGQRGS